MKARNFIPIIAIICFVCTGAAAQNTLRSFMDYAQRADSLYRISYDKKDYKSTVEILNKALKKYKALPEKDRNALKGADIDIYYNLSCSYSLLGDKPHAVEALQKAADAGYGNHDHLLEDHDLDNIRNEPGYAAAQQKVQNLGDYMHILKKASAYNDHDARPLPAFTYQVASDPHLTELRKGFNLDSIAGSGSDAMQVVNLMRWVHYLIPHDGQHNNPSVMNAMDLIATCKKGKRGLNCRGLAIVLNECYLAMGYKSRIVTCLPKDSMQVDMDCHVINAVYVPSLKKWLWMDPTNNAYLTDEQGQLLGIQEVRQRLTEGRPLILPPDINWNHQYQTKQFYLYHYMAKNLYMLECPAESKYDMEDYAAHPRATYIRLLPMEYYKQKPDSIEQQFTDVKFTKTVVMTNNEAAFWAAPSAVQ